MTAALMKEITKTTMNIIRFNVVAIVMAVFVTILADDLSSQQSTGVSIDNDDIHRCLCYLLH